MASHAPMPSSTNPTTSPITTETESSNTPAAATETENDKNSLNEEDNNDKILPNYKKVKKLIADYIPKSLKSVKIEPSEPPPTNLASSDDAVQHLTSTSLVEEDNSVEIIKASSSDSNNIHDDNDNNDVNSNNDRVENKNLFNTIDLQNNNNKMNANTNNDNNEIHSSVDEQQKKHQVPDVEHSIDLGNIQEQQQQFIQDDNADMANG